MGVSIKYIHFFILSIFLLVSVNSEAEIDGDRNDKSVKIINIPTDPFDPFDKTPESRLDDFLKINEEKINLEELLKESVSTEASASRYPNINEYYPFGFEYEYFTKGSFERKAFYENTKEEEEVSYSKETLCDISLRKHWDVKRKYIDVAQAHMSVMGSIGRLLPQISLSFNLQLVPIDVSKLFAGLFGFVMPYRWFELLKNLKLLDSQRMAVIDMMLDHYSICELAYINTSKVLWDYIIYSQFYYSTQFIVNDLNKRDLKLNTSSSDAIMMLFNIYRRGILDTKKRLRTDLLPNLAQEGNLYLNQRGNVNTNETISPDRHFMIQTVKFPLISGVRNLDIKSIWPKVLEFSYKLQVIRHLAASKEYSSMQAATLGIGTVDVKSSSFGIFYGIDNITNAIWAKEDVLRSGADYLQAKSALYNSLLQAVNLFNMSLEQIIYLTKWVEFAKSYVEPSLKNFMIDPKLGGADRFSVLSLSYLDLNNAYHNLMLANASINRLLVSPILTRIKKTIPHNIEVKLKYIEGRKKMRKR
jgi:hypothetical protein